MIEVTDVTVELGDKPVLTDISLSVEAGELVGLIGPNGAGKTTLLRVVAGMIDPSAGAVCVRGEPVADLSQRALSRRLAVVPQSTEPSFAFDVRDIVAMGRTPYYSRLGNEDPGGDRATESALERTATEHLADRSIADVSGGERQRVLIARALAQETPALLLDEPTANLDINHQIGTFELVTDLVDDGKAVVAAIHDLALAARYCDRLMLISGGNTLAVGTPAEVLQSDRLRRAFDTDVAVYEDPATGHPTVTPIPARPRNAVRVAIIGGGRAAAPVIRRLDRAGYELTVGILRTGDRDERVANALGIETLTTASDDRYPPELVSRMRERVEAAAAVVVADREFDDRSKVLLDIAGAASRLVLVEERPFQQRNRAGPEVRSRYRDLQGMARVSSLEEVTEQISTVLTEPSKDGPPTRIDREL